MKSFIEKTEQMAAEKKANMPKRPRSRRRIEYTYSEPLATFKLGKDEFQLDVSKLPLDVKVQAMLEGILGRLKATRAPEILLTGVRAGKWPQRPMAKPVMLPARVEAYMRAKGVPEDSARALAKNKEMTSDVKVAYYEIMAERARVD